jgi:hypothetical protein
MQTELLEPQTEGKFKQDICAIGISELGDVNGKAKASSSCGKREKVLTRGRERANELMLQARLLQKAVEPSPHHGVHLL